MMYAHKLVAEGEACPNCDKPVVYQRESPIFRSACIRGFGGPCTSREPVDWRARALAAEARTTQDAARKEAE